MTANNGQNSHLLNKLVQLDVNKLLEANTNHATSLHMQYHRVCHALQLQLENLQLLNFHNDDGPVSFLRNGVNFTYATVLDFILVFTNIK